MAQFILRAPQADRADVILSATLGDTPNAAIDYEAIHSAQHSVCSDVAWSVSFLASAFEEGGKVGVRAQRALHELTVNGEPITTNEINVDGVVTLTPCESQSLDGRRALKCIFRNLLGLARIEVTRVTGYGQNAQRQTLTSEPVFILIPEGNAKTIRQMSDYVMKSLRVWGKDFGSQGFAGFLESANADKLSQTLAQRLQAVESLLKLYEQQASYFRANARFRLVSGERVDGIGRLNGFSESTLRYVIEHPDDLVPTTNGRGLRIGNRQYMPQHALVQSSKKTFDLVENQLILGFLKTLEKRLIEEVGELAARKARLPVLMAAEEGYVSSAEAILGEALLQLDRYEKKITQCLAQTREIFFQYQQMLPVMPLETATMPPPTQIFLSIPAYRLIYDAMLRWREMGTLSMVAEDLLLTTFERSRLYELFTLLWQLDAISNAGLTCVRREHFAYSTLTPKRNFSELPNTFAFERRDATGALVQKLTLFYEPVIRVPTAKLPVGENGVGLIRTSPLSIDAREGGLQVLNNPDLMFYTPDFVVRNENSAGQVTWFIADAKYTSLENAITTLTQEILFKYLFSVRPTKPTERLGGVWLLCAYDNKTLSLNTTRPWLPGNVADLHFEHLTVGQIDKSEWIETICGH